jgi:hypothetical protein
MKEILAKLSAWTANNSVDDYCDGTDGANCGQVEDVVSSVINVITWVIGIIAVIMLIFGGIQYATSAGDEKKVTTAKNTIIYAVVGLAIALLAFVLVNFVFRVTAE